MSATTSGWVLSVLSEAMIEKARKATARMGVNNVTLMVSSMENAEIGRIDFADSGFRQFLLWMQGVLELSEKTD